MKVYVAKEIRKWIIGWKWSKKYEKTWKEKVQKQEKKLNKKFLLLLSSGMFWVFAYKISPRLASHPAAISLNLKWIFNLVHFFSAAVGELMIKENRGHDQAQREKRNAELSAISHSSAILTLKFQVHIWIQKCVEGKTGFEMLLSRVCRILGGMRGFN